MSENGTIDDTAIPDPNPPDEAAADAAKEQRRHRRDRILIVVTAVIASALLVLAIFTLPAALQGRDEARDSEKAAASALSASVAAAEAAREATDASATAAATVEVSACRARYTAVQEVAMGRVMRAIAIALKALADEDTDALNEAVVEGADAVAELEAATADIRRIDELCPTTT